MIVVRDVFRLKFGKAREMKALWLDAEPTRKEVGMDRMRVLTDLTGEAYQWVLESEFESLSDYEATMATMFATDEWRTLYERIIPLVETSRREIYTVVE